MQFLKDIQKSALGFLNENSSAILTAGGVVGTVITAVLTGRAAVKATRIIETAESDATGKKSLELGRELIKSERTGVDEFVYLSKMEKAQLIFPHVIPPVLVGGATIASIIMSNRMSAQKAAALAAAYGLAEGRLNEYKEKVAEKLSPAKQQQIVDELAQESVNQSTGHTQVIITEGDVLCFDKATGRYFRSSMEKINRAKNATNTEILAHYYATASYFYDELELEGTSWTDDVGWAAPAQVDLEISTTLKDDKPCLVIDFKRMPTLDYRSDYS